MSLDIDFSKTAQDYAKHRVGFPSALIARLKPFAIGINGQNVLDIGTGTGSLARLMAMEGCNVTAHDPSEKLNQMAKFLSVTLIGCQFLILLRKRQKLSFLNTTPHGNLLVAVDFTRVG
ncbi:class I SAM-dependent methyltransferase [Fluviispira vulneris]|uniref:class I SAM-dependent methyltransferase n=1 Tax=Fluviispira vulneris TaxID=2763012 RepID=UPI001C981DE4|nr:methyltransferase domain-containing protein [Fluviispira vulneris]